MSKPWQIVFAVVHSADLPLYRLALLIMAPVGQPADRSRTWCREDSPQRLVNIGGYHRFSAASAEIQCVQCRHFFTSSYTASAEDAAVVVDGQVFTKGINRQFREKRLESDIIPSGNGKPFFMQFRNRRSIRKTCQKWVSLCK